MQEPVSACTTGAVSGSVHVPGSGQDDDPIRIPAWSAKDVKGFVRATRLCQRCLPMLGYSQCERASRQKINFELHGSENSLIRSVENGCQICTWVEAAYNRRFLHRRSLKLGQGGQKFRFTFYHDNLIELFVANAQYRCSLIFLSLANCKSYRPRPHQSIPTHFIHLGPLTRH